MEALRALMQKHPGLQVVWRSLFGVPIETGKGGASHEISSNGIWSLADVHSASAELGRESVDRAVNNAVRFINAWKDAEEQLGKTQ
jgi:creatinine amidohydrolase/Fe(II)-dependent formamide hydrolase-like protein